jgi:hypothetical protein
MNTLSALAVAFLLLCGSASAQTPDKLGPMTIADMIELPGWFAEDFVGYMPQPEYANAIPAHMNDVEIICILGTWCSDSKREVPRMIRILQAKNIPPEKLKMIGVDRSKRDPDGLSQRYNIERVPTFVFLRGGKEIGRIVESPLASLEKDMLGIIDPDAGKAAPPPPQLPPPPITIEHPDGSVQHPDGQHHPDAHHPDGHHPPHPHGHEHPQQQADPQPK